MEENRSKDEIKQKRAMHNTVFINILLASLQLSPYRACVLAAPQIYSPSVDRVLALCLWLPADDGQRRWPLDPNSGVWSSFQAQRQSPLVVGQNLMPVGVELPPAHNPASTVPCGQGPHCPSPHPHLKSSYPWCSLPAPASTPPWWLEKWQAQHFSSRQKKTFGEIKEKSLSVSTDNAEGKTNGLWHTCWTALYCWLIAFKQWNCQDLVEKLNIQKNCCLYQVIQQIRDNIFLCISKSPNWGLF